MADNTIDLIQQTEIDKVLAAIDAVNKLVTSIADANGKTIDIEVNLKGQSGASLQTVIDQTTALKVQQEQLTTATQQYMAAVANINASLAAYTGEQRMEIEILVRQQTALAQNSQQQKELKKAIDNTSETYVRQQAILKERELALKAEAAATQANAKALISANTSQIGSIQELKAQLKLLQSAYESLSISQRGNGSGLELAASISSLKTQLNTAKDATKAFGVEEEVATTKSSRFEQAITRIGLRFIIYNGIFQTAIKVFEAIGTSFQEASDRINYKQIALEEGAKNASKSFSEEAVELSVMRDRFLDTTTSMEEKQKIVQTLNDKYGDQIGHLLDINSTEKLFRDKTDDFIEALNKRAIAEGYYTTIVKNTQKLAEAQANPASLNGGISNTFSGIRAFGQALVQPGATAGDFVSNVVKNYASITQGNGKATLYDTLAPDIKKTNDFLIEEIKKAYKASDDAAIKAGVNLDPKKGGKTKQPKDFTGIDLKTSEETAKKLGEINQQIILAEAEKDKQIFDNEKDSLNVRLAAEKDFTSKERDASNAYYDGKIDAENKALDEINTLEKKGYDNLTNVQKTIVAQKTVHEAELQLLTVQSANKQEEITTQSLKREQNIITNSIQEAEKIIRDGYNTQKDIVDTAMRVQLDAVQANLDQGNISYKQAQIDKQDILTKYQKILADTEVKYLQDELKKLQDGGASKSVIDYVQDLINKSSDSSSKSTAKPVADGDRLIADVFGLDKDGIAKFKAGADLAKNIIGDLQTTTDAYFKSQIDGKNAQIKNIQDSTNLQVQAEQDSYDSAATKQQKIAALNSTAALQEKALQDQANQLKRQQAAADKVFAVEKIILNTESSASKAYADALELGPEGLILAPIAAGVVIALGAAQLALAIAAPIPQYFKGTKDAKGGTSIVGEKGVELVNTPSGDQFFTPSTATIMDIPKGSEIYTAEETMRMVQNAGRREQLLSSTSVNNNGELIRSNEAVGRQIVYAINNIKQPRIQKEDTWWAAYKMRQTQG